MKSQIHVRKPKVHTSKKSAFIFLLALLCGTAQAQGSQSLSLIFESEPSERPLHFQRGDLPEKRLHDANGDGTPDLILAARDDDGNLHRIRVVDIASGTTLWQMKDVPQTLGIVDDTDNWAPFFFGFADPDGDGVREALFGLKSGDVLLFDPDRNALEWSHGSALTQMGRDPNCILVDVKDLTGDGFPELIIGLKETRQVQVWSRAH